MFWNPGCGFCRDMHEELRSCEAGLNGDGRALVIASSGSREATIAEGFSSTVVLDQDQRLAGAFGAHGTPMAVLVAPDGTVASNAAAPEPRPWSISCPIRSQISPLNRRRPSALPFGLALPTVGELPAFTDTGPL